MFMEIRPVKLADVDSALALINAEGWEYSKEEIERMIRLDPGGSFFYIDHKPVGVITTVTFGRTGVIGHLVVSKDARGRRVGQSLLKHAVDCLETAGIESIILYATPDGERLYKRYGFAVRGLAYATKAINNGEYDSSRTELLGRVVSKDLEQIIMMDQELFGDDRGKMIRHLHDEFPAHSFKAERDGRIVGYAFGRKSSVARDLGPWGCTSTDRNDAEAVFGACVQSMGRGPVFFGVFQKNQQAWEIAVKLHIMRAWPTQLMVRGRERYTGALSSIFGIVGFELG
jgi:ribosomal protein S18 acetylase RimI-like enzyme